MVVIKFYGKIDGGQENSLNSRAKGCISCVDSVTVVFIKSTARTFDKGEAVLAEIEAYGRYQAEAILTVAARIVPEADVAVRLPNGDAKFYAMGSQIPEPTAEERRLRW